MLQKQGLIWVDVQPAFELVDTRAELEKALLDFEAFFRSLVAAGGSVARRMLIV